MHEAKLAPTVAPPTSSGSPRGVDTRRDEYLEQELCRYARAPDDDPEQPRRRSGLIAGYLPLVRNLARRLAAAGSTEDLEQAGAIGLINAIDRYDPDTSTAGPLSYLVPTIRGEMLRHLRDHSWSVRVPRIFKERSVTINRVLPVLTQRLGRAPRPSEIAAELGLTVDDVVDTLAAIESRFVSSFDVPDRNGEPGNAFVDRMGAEDPHLEIAECRGPLRQLIGQLPSRERAILTMRFFEDRTQSDIAAEMGISQMHVSRLLARTLTDLNRKLAAAD